MMSKNFTKNEGNKFLAYIKAGRVCATWEYKTGCFLIWANGTLAKLEGEKQYSYINGRGWVGY